MSKLEVNKTYTLTSSINAFVPFVGTVKDNLSYDSAIRRDFTLDEKNRIAHGANVTFDQDERFYEMVASTGQTIIIADSWISTYVLSTGIITKITVTDLPEPVKDIIKDILSTNSIDFTID